MYRRVVIAMVLAVVGAGLLRAVSQGTRVTDPLGLADRLSVLFVDNQNPACRDDYPRTAALSPQTPWCNIEPAVVNRDLRPGDTIYVRGGTYEVALRNDRDPYGDRSDNCRMTPQVSGTSGRPISLKAYAGESVLIDGTWNIRDHNADGRVDQTWQQCQWTSNTCAAPCGGIPTQAACTSTQYLTYTWAEGFPYYPDKGQLWDGGLIPSLRTGNFAGFVRAGVWMKDPNARRIFYRPNRRLQARASPDNQITQITPNLTRVGYANCAAFLLFEDVSHWLVEGINLSAGAGTGYSVSRRSGSGTESVDVTIEGCRTSYFGNNACTPSRDGTFGHGLWVGNGPGVLVRNNEFSQDVAECVHVSNVCPDNSCGEVFERNVVRECGQDPGWNSECAPGYGEAFGNETAPGVIVRSNGGVYVWNQFLNNDGEALLIESERSQGEGVAYPSNVTVSHNTFTGNGGPGVSADCKYGNIPSADNLVFRNLFVRNSFLYRWLGQIALMGNCDRWRIVGNRIESESGVEDIRIGSYDAGTCQWDGGASGACVPEDNDALNAPAPAPAAPQNLRIVR